MQDIRSIITNRLSKRVAQKGKGGEPQGSGGEDYCICPVCKKQIPHKRKGQGKSKPCTAYRCPDCGVPLMGLKEYQKIKNK